MEKETLVKHHFWILLVLALILIPVALGGVWFGVAQATEAKKKKVADQVSELARVSAPGKAYVAKLEDYRKSIDGTKGDVWKGVYLVQSDLIQWPIGMTNRATLNQYYFGDPVPDPDRNAFRDEEEKEYKRLVADLKPTELEKGEKCFRMIDWKKSTKSATDEDVWLALEDLCVQREIVRCIYDVNQLLANLQRVPNSASLQAEIAKQLKTGGDDKAPTGEKYFRFISPYWQLDLGVSVDSGSSVDAMRVRHRLTNHSHRRLNVAHVEFKLAFGKHREVEDGDSAQRAGLRSRRGFNFEASPTLVIESELLPVGEATLVKEKIISGTGAEPEVLGVQQVLDASYVPVKRVDRIELGYHSHRTSDKPLLMNSTSDKAKKAAELSQPPPDPNQPPAPSGAPGAAAPPVELSTNGLPRMRYLTVTDQVRRMPIGVVLVVDQAHVQDVLRAFANSRLRFQTTQVHVTRLPPTGGQTGGPTGGPSGGQAGYPPPSVPSVTPMRPPISVIPAPPPPAGTAMMTNQPTASSPVEGNGNLVEIALYGLASIYEKYPPRPTATGQLPEAATPPASPPSTDPTPVPAPPATPATPPVIPPGGAPNPGGKNAAPKVG